MYNKLSIMESNKSSNVFILFFKELTFYTVQFVHNIEIVYIALHTVITLA